MSWCDKLNSVPSLGLLYPAKLISADAVIGCLSPILDRRAAGQPLNFKIARADLNSIQLDVDDGFTYLVDSRRIIVGFTHRMALRPTSGDLPSLRIVSDVRPFTVRLRECEERLSEFASALPGLSDRLLQRIGVVTNTNVSIGDAPPGLQRIYEFFTSPWPAVEGVNVNVVGHLADRRDHLDKCSHQIVVPEPEQEDQVPTFVFDWMRTFKTPELVLRDDLQKILRAGVGAALEYFEKLGERGLQDV